MSPTPFSTRHAVLLSALVLLVAGTGALSPAKLAWTQGSGQATDVAVAPDGTVWAIGAEPAGVPDKAILVSSPEGWTTLPGAAVRIAAGPNGQAAVVNSAGEIYTWEGSWKKMPGAALDVCYGTDGSLVAAGKDGDVHRWSGSAWSKIEGGDALRAAGGAHSLAIGARGEIWAVAAKGEIFKHGGATPWKRMPGAAKDIAVAPNGAVFAIAASGAVQRLEGTRWVPEPGASGTRIAAGTNGLAYVARDAAPMLVRGTPAAVRPAFDRARKTPLARPDQAAPVEPAPAPIGTAKPAPTPGTPLDRPDQPADPFVPSVPEQPAPIVVPAGTWTVPAPTPAPQPGAISIQAPAPVVPISTPILQDLRPPAQFVALDGKATDVGMGADGTMWLIGTESVGGNFPIYRHDGATWKQLPGGAVRVAVDPKGAAWVVNAGHMIFRWNGTQWDQMPGGATDVGIGADGTVWVIGTDGAAWKWTGSAWSSAGGGITAIAVGPDGKPWAINPSGGVWRHDGSGWKQIPGSGSDIAVDASGSVYILGSSPVAGGYSVQRYTGQAWVSESATGVRLSAGPAGRLIIAKDAASGSGLLAMVPPGSTPAGPMSPVGNPASPGGTGPISVTLTSPTQTVIGIPAGGIPASGSGSAIGGTLQSGTGGGGSLVGLPGGGASEPLVVSGIYTNQITPGQLMCSDGGNPDSSRCGFVAAINMGSLHEQWPHQCPEGSFHDPIFGGSCWSCGDWRRTGKPVDSDEACDAFVYAEATWVKDAPTLFTCPSDSIWDPMGSCWTCPSGYARSEYPVNGKWGCKRVGTKVAEFKKNLGCPQQTEWSLGKPKVFPDIGLNTCYACPTGDATTGDVLITDRSMYRADGTSACRVEMRWRPSEVVPLKIATAERGTALPGSGELTSKILDEPAVISDFLRHMAVQEKIPSTRVQDYVDSRWAEIAANPGENHAIKALLYQRALNALRKPADDRTGAERRLLEAFQKQAQARTVAVPQNALDMYRAWKTSVEQARANRAHNVGSFFYYGTVPPDFDVAGQSTAALGTTGLGTLAWAASSAAYFANTAVSAAGTSGGGVQVINGIVNATTALRAMLQAGQMTDAVAKTATSLVTGAQGAITGVATMAAATSAIAIVGAVLISIAIDQVVEIATAEQKLQAKLDAAQQPIRLEDLLTTSDGMTRLTYFWSAMLEAPTGQADSNLATKATQVRTAAKAAGYPGVAR